MLTELLAGAALGIPATPADVEAVPVPPGQDAATFRGLLDAELHRAWLLRTGDAPDLARHELAGVAGRLGVEA